jgi:hypothetical protein
MYIVFKVRDLLLREEKGIPPPSENVILNHEL